MSSSIATRQNDRYALDLLAAQRVLYSEVKRLRRLRTGLTAGAAAGSIALASAIEPARVPVGLLSGTGLLLFGLVAAGRERRHRQIAATIQEEFDTYVFGLPWNALLADPPPTDLVVRYANRRRRRVPDRDLTDWYPPPAGGNHVADMLMCQRVNVSWSTPLHRSWATFLGVVLAALVLAVTVLGVTGPLSGTDLAVAVIAPLLAPVQGLAEALRDNVVHARQSARLHAEILALWRSARDGATTVTTSDCRQVQDRLFQLRAAGPLVPDRLYRWRHRPLADAVQAQVDHLSARSRSGKELP
ncbi:S-4TM family putative pore-forming effector [Micromonospora cathayae]|uniref:S-4TM family putative pore-forming effector n=1 Tax=Micromonospora cathayae TaxID=3028804 RepID=A0ABY7ZWK4_9ACTN|nr:S-4TM family putative pore-forming effector [Micromonospora sp. HUAS 3]WDZ87268.1 S-4TM family putative pore-forming effector [Micromonospora sp. HUAS 3]